MKKIIALILSIALIAVLSGCGKDTSNIAGPSGTDAVMTIDGTEVSADFYRYTMVGEAMKKAHQDPNFTGDYSAIDWNSISDEVKDATLKAIKGRAALLAYAEKLNIKLSSEELESVDSMVSDYIERNGKNNFMTQLKIMGLSTEDGFKDSYKKELLSSKAIEEVVANYTKYIPEDVDLSGYIEKERACVKHILIMNSTTKHENPEVAIKGVLARAKAGEDFDKLVEEFNEDPGVTDIGYTFGPGEMVKEFEDASFNLSIGEISDVVKSTYGYHIIKRIIGEPEVVNYLVSTMEEPVINDKINEFVLSDIMNDVNDAINQLKAESEAK